VKPVLIKFPDELLEKIDNKAQGLGLTRSAYVKMILTKDVKED